VKKIDELPSRFEGLLDERQMNGPIILAQMQKLVDRSSNCQQYESNKCLKVDCSPLNDSTTANTQGAGPKYHVFPYISTASIAVSLTIGSFRREHSQTLTVTGSAVT